MDVIQSVPWYKDPVAWSAIVAAAATLVYAVVTIFLWKATKRTADIAEHATNISQRSVDLTQKMFDETNRPYIGIEKLDCKKINGQKRVDLIFRNFGTVTAQDVWSELKVFHNGRQVDSHRAKPILAHQDFGFICTHTIIDDVFTKHPNWTLDLEITVETHYKSMAGVEFVGNYLYQYAPEYGGLRIESATETRSPHSTRDAVSPKPRVIIHRQSSAEQSHPTQTGYLVSNSTFG